MLAERAESVQWRRGTAIRSKRSGLREGCVNAPWWARLCLGVFDTGGRRCELHIVCFGP